MSETTEIVQSGTVVTEHHVERRFSLMKSGIDVYLMCDGFFVARIRPDGTMRRSRYLSSDLFPVDEEGRIRIVEDE